MSLDELPSTSHEAVLSEPWLFETLIDELDGEGLGIHYIYAVLDRLAERHQLEDVVLVLRHESFGTQVFRNGARAVSPSVFARVPSGSGLVTQPDVVPAHECDAVRTACQLVLMLHLASFNAGHDPLTSVENRRSFDGALQVAATRSARYGWAFTLVLIDLNDFKLINDRRGHVVGDFVLRQFGFALRRSVRSGDTAARLGGDEFAVILANAGGLEAAGFVERLRSQLKESEEPIEFSVGVATSPRDSVDPEELIRVADRRLYERKGRGES